MSAFWPQEVFRAAWLWSEHLDVTVPNLRSKVDAISRFEVMVEEKKEGWVKAQATPLAAQ